MDSRTSRALNRLIGSSDKSTAGLLRSVLESALDRRSVNTGIKQPSHGFSKGDWIYFTGSTYALADRDSDATLADGVVSSVLSADEFLLVTGGIVDGLSGLTAGSVYYLSSTAGTMTVTKPTSGNSQQLGRALTANSFQVSIQETMDPSIQTIPVGVIQPYVSTTPPTGWLLCDGSTIGDVSSGADLESASYESLFELVKSVAPNAGTEVWANGDTVALPDIKGRVVVGYDAAQTEFDALGETGGAKTHTLIESELPSHTHTTSTAHSHGLVHTALAVAAGTDLDHIGTGGASGTYNTESASAGSVTGGAGSDGAHNNLSPYLALPHIIKY